MNKIGFIIVKRDAIKTGCVPKGSDFVGRGLPFMAERDVSMDKVRAPRRAVFFRRSATRVRALVQPIRVQPTKPDAPLVLLPMTYEPGKTGQYSITIYSSKPIYVKGGECIQPAADDGDHDDDADIKALFCEGVLEAEDPGGHPGQHASPSQASAATDKSGGSSASHAKPQQPVAGCGDAKPAPKGQSASVPQCNVPADTASLEEMANKQVAAARDQLKQAEQFMDFVRKLKSARGIA